MILVMLPLLALLGFSLRKFRVINCSARLICSSTTCRITPLFFDTHSLPISSRIQCKIAIVCLHTVFGTAPPYLSDMLHLSTFTLSHSLFARPPILGTSVFRRWAEGSWGRDPFTTSDLWSATLSLSGNPLHSLLLSQNWKPPLLFYILNFCLLFSTNT